MDKKAYREKMEAQLQEWKAELDKLEAQAKMKSADTKISYANKRKELEAKMAEVRGNLRSLKDSGDQKWDVLKDHLEKGKDDIKKNYNELVAALKES